MTILVTGFGPFDGVDVNPTQALVESIHGARVGGQEVVGRVLPVAFERAVSLTVSWALEVDARWIIGTGVAVRRDRVTVERWGRRVVPTKPDVHGRCPAPGPGPDRVSSSVDVIPFAQALGAELSEDAGVYVCNAWLYGVVRGCSSPATFVHVPPHGVPRDVFLTALASLRARS